MDKGLKKIDMDQRGIDLDKETGIQKYWGN